MLTALERMMCLILSLGDALTEKEDVLSLPSDKQLEFAAQYLLSNGVILPPCNIGDEVYRIVKRCGEWHIVSYKVKTITYHGGEWWDINDGMLGSTVFLTCEEAEAALGRMKEVKNE